MPTPLLLIVRMSFAKCWAPDHGYIIMCPTPLLLIVRICFAECWAPDHGYKCANPITISAIGGMGCVECNRGCVRHLENETVKYQLTLGLHTTDTMCLDGYIGVTIVLELTRSKK